MDVDGLKRQVNKKLFLLDSFLLTAGLRPNDNPQAVLKHAVTGYFLQSLALELILKMLFELDCRKTAPFTHDLPALFSELDRSTKTFLEDRFNEARERQVHQFASASEDFQFQSLDDVLAANESTVKNFKYDAVATRSNSSADALFYREVVEFIEDKLNNLMS